MPENPIIDVLVPYMSKGKQVRAIRPTKLGHHPDGVVLTMLDGKEFTHRFTTKDHDEFMKYWHQARAWFRIQWIQLEEDDPKPSPFTVPAVRRRPRKK